MGTEEQRGHATMTEARGDGLEAGSPCAHPVWVSTLACQRHMGTARKHWGHGGLPNIDSSCGGL